MARLDAATEELDAGGHTPLSVWPEADDPTIAMESANKIGLEYGCIGTRLYRYQFDSSGQLLKNRHYTHRDGLNR